MDTLRIILIVIGIAVIVGIYFWDRYNKKEHQDYYVSPEPNTDDAPGLVITTSTKFNEDDLTSELADLNYFMGNRNEREFHEDVIDEDGIQVGFDDDSSDDEINEYPPVIDEEVEFDEPHHELIDEPEDTSLVSELIVVLHLMAGDDEKISGTELKEVVEDAGFEFGDMNIFHYRDIDMSGELQTIFSLVNMFEPGYFDPKKMNEFTTRGISIFATLKNDGSGLHVFETMLVTARQVAAQLGVNICGPDKTLLSDQSLDNIYGKLKEAM